MNTRTTVIGTVAYARPFERVGHRCSVIGMKDYDVLEHNLAGGHNVVVFTGGEDVYPRLYGEAPHRKTYYSAERDVCEIGMWNLIRRDYPGTLCVGICRGSQFLNVMNGAKLVQHIPAHGVNHGVYPAGCIVDLCDDHVVARVTSTHHQCVDRVTLQPGAQLLATAQHDGVVEAVWYSDTKSLCIQWHPEFYNLPDGCWELTRALFEYAGMEVD